MSCQRIAKHASRRMSAIGIVVYFIGSILRTSRPILRARAGEFHRAGAGSL